MKILPEREREEHFEREGNQTLDPIMHTGDPLPMKKHRTEVDQAADKQRMGEERRSRLGE